MAFGTPFLSNDMVEGIHGMPYKESLQARIWMYMPDLSGANTQVLVDFLSSMLQMNPRERVNPKDLLCHRWWLNEVGVGCQIHPCKCGAQASGEIPTTTTS
jgi:hypothetical protein